MEFSRSCPLFLASFGKLRLSDQVQIIAWLPAADRNHVNTSWGDTVKCLLDAGKAPYLEYNGKLYGFSAVKVKLVDSLI